MTDRLHLALCRHIHRAALEVQSLALADHAVIAAGHLVVGDTFAAAQAARAARDDALAHADYDPAYIPLANAADTLIRQLEQEATV